MKNMAEKENQNVIVQRLDTLAGLMAKREWARLLKEEVDARAIRAGYNPDTADEWVENYVNLGVYLDQNRFMTDCFSEDVVPFQAELLFDECKREVVSEVSHIEHLCTLKTRVSVGAEVSLVYWNRLSDNYPSPTSVSVFVPAFAGSLSDAEGARQFHLRQFIEAFTGGCLERQAVNEGTQDEYFSLNSSTEFNVVYPETVHRFPGSDGAATSLMNLGGLRKIAAELGSIYSCEIGSASPDHLISGLKRVMRNSELLGDVLKYSQGFGSEE